ncbi:MAG: helix-turn-helix domain-containing protein [Phycisphaeraceae bacterium]
MATAHRHQDLELNYVLHGRMTYLIGGSLVTLPQRRLCVLWGGMPHQSIFEHEQESAQLIWVTVPLTEVLAWDLPEVLIGRLLKRGFTIDSMERSVDEPTLRAWERDLALPSEARRDLVRQEIRTRLRRLALDLPAAPPPDAVAFRGDDDLQVIERMARHVADHYQEPVQVAEIAEAAGLHPSYAMTIFRRRTGMTLNEYLTRQRIAHAQRLLATTRRSILNIGFDSGFGSTSRFFEAFKRYAGCTPRQFRVRLAHRERML